MMHPHEHQLRAYIDREVQGEKLRKLDAHLSDCASCRQKVEKMRFQAERVAFRLTSLEGRPPRWTARQARQRLDILIEQKQKENTSMLKSFFRRPAWIGLAVVMVLGISLAFPQVRAFATGFLKIFRVQQIAVIPIDPSNFDERMDGSSIKIEELVSDNLTYDSLGERQTVQDAAQASELVGFETRLPSAGDQAPELIVQPGANGSFTLDVERVNLMLKELGQEDLSISPELNGATVDFEIPSAVAAAYGTCNLDQVDEPRPESMHDLPRDAAGSDCVVFLQMPSPTVSTPEGLDLDRLGQAFFRMAGLSDEEAQQLSAKIDWSSTLVLPIPASKANVSDVQVDGVDGVLIQEEGGTRRDQFVLTWVKDGQLYAVTGSGDPARGLALANSLQ